MTAVEPSPTTASLRCRLCHSEDTRLVLKADDFDVMRCSRCGSGLAHFPQQGTDPAHDEFDDRYEADFDDRKAVLCWELLSGLVETRPGRRLLDVGCGRGAFLDVARAHGLDTTGLEPSPAAASFAAQRHPVIATPVAALTPRVGQFDVITLWDVLEHLADPGAALRSLRSLLSPGGFLVILTPMMGSAYDRLAVASHRITGGRARQLVRMCWSEDHLTRFQPDGLLSMLVGQGFSPVSVRRILLLSLRRDRYAGGSVLPRWTSSDAVNRCVSVLGVALARAGRVHNKVLVCVSADSRWCGTSATDSAVTGVAGRSTGRG